MMIQQEEMSILSHLDELRKRLIFCLFTILIGSLAAYFQAQNIIGFLKVPLGEIDLIFISPTEGFILTLKAAFLGGVVLALPIIFWQTMLFVAPALYLKEKIILFAAFPFMIILFGCGAFFGFSFLLPMTLHYLLGFSEGLMVPMLSASNYFSFVTSFILGLGIVFELPMVLLILSKFGVIHYKTLAKKRKYMLFLIIILSAIITPPDAISQLAVALPLVCLFELSLGLMFLFEALARPKSQRIETP